MNQADVEASTIFLTLTGSRAYGTNNDDSDVDIRGVCIPKDHSYYTGMGINSFGQMDKGWADDRVVYDLRKALNLMCQANPNALELAFVDQSKWIQTSPQWERIVQHRDKLLSKQVRFRYAGYSYSQLKRIQNHRRFLLSPLKAKPLRADFGLQEEKVLKPDDLGAYEWLLAQTLKRSTQYLDLSETTKQELYDLNHIGLVQNLLADNLSEQTWKTIQTATNASDEFIATMMREKAYTNALNDWSAYQNWRTERNDKRRALEERYGYDTKHAMHLIRLSRMCVEILEGKGVLVCRSDADELKAIRNGSWSYEQVVEHAEECDHKAEELYKTTTLPKAPDRVFWDKLCQELIEETIW